MASILLSILGTLTTIIVGLGVYWLTKRTQTKALSYTSSSTPIATVQHPFANDLKISFLGREVQDVSVVSFTLKNSGKVPILRTDFDGPLKVYVPNTGGILAAYVSDAKPYTLPVSLKEFERQKDRLLMRMVEVSPLLLNPGDEFTLLAVVSGVDTHDRAFPEARIVGLSDVDRYDSKANRQSRFKGIPIWSLLSFILLWFALASFFSWLLHYVITHPGLVKR